MITIDRFVEEHRGYEISETEFLTQSHSNIGNIHNHTIENLYLYFNLTQHIERGRVYFYPGCVFIRDNRRYKWFLFDIPTFLEFFNISIFSEAIRSKMIFYSSLQLVEYKDLLVESKIKEAVYDLEQVFSEQTYYDKYPGKSRKEVKKKIYNRIVYPFRFLEKLNLRVVDISSSHLEDIDSLHREWCTVKLDNPNTFKMMFSSNRYNRCINDAVNQRIPTNPNWFKKAFYLEDRLVAVRLCLLVDRTSYDIAFFSRFWDSPSNITNYLNTWCLNSLRVDYGILYHNCGAELDKHLKRFKQHFPSEDRITYKYNFKK